jgi:regulator of sigma E protease
MTLLAFILALGVLIAVHEYGHYRVAVACGVKVLRFSIGFGRPIVRWRLKDKPTEFVIGLLPLGGYVRMLDEREGPVDPAERHLAFNNRPLSARAAVVAAGPLANLVLAVALYALVNWVGQEESQPILSTPVAGSVAERAGLRSGERVLEAGEEGEELRPVRSFEELQWHLTRGVLEGQELRLMVQASAERGPVREVRLELAGLPRAELDAQLFRAIGLTSPFSLPVIGQVREGGAAQRAGLVPGDLVKSVDGRRVADALQLREWIRQSAPDRAQTWEVWRSGQLLALAITPRMHEEGGRQVARIGAAVGAPPAMDLVRDEPWDAVLAGVQKTWEVGLLTVRMIGRMLIGEASLKNLSGPLTIADYAGKSAQMGWVSYLLFLALISVSLGVLNLLPLPMLDGGHLMYYLFELITGRSVSDVWMDRLQRGGFAILMAMMAIALFNDVSRLFA